VARVVRSVDGPYQSDRENLPPGGTLTVPGDWGALLGAEYRGLVCYSRSFNWPAQLAEGEAAWLVFEGVDHAASVALNGQPLGNFSGYAAPARFLVTPLLQPHNQLSVDVELPQAVFNDPTLRPGRAGGAGGLVGEVRLEIVTAD